MLLHHTLGNGDFNVFAQMSATISCATVKITDAYEAATLIDHALRECWIQSQPVYIALPTDMVHKKVDGVRLQTPIDLTEPLNQPEREEYAVDVVLRYLHAAQKPVILVDAGAIRHRALDVVHDLIQKSGLPSFVTPMGKGAIDETIPNYGGVYAGDGSNKGVRERIESADLILSIGALKSDFNTTGFSYRTSQLNTIDFGSDYVQVRYSMYPQTRMRAVLEKVVKRMGPLNVKPSSSLLNNTVPPGSQPDDGPTDGVITHSWLWPTIGGWLQENDIVITDTGTASFGIWETIFPKNVTAISQVLWGSIGYSVGACLGAALAAKAEGQKRRVILFVGDGSFQMTALEVSTMLRQELNPIMSVDILLTIPPVHDGCTDSKGRFVLCNDGYTIERHIHGWNAEYNDIQPWRHGDLVRSFDGHGISSCKTYQVSTKDELGCLFRDIQFSSAPFLQVSASGGHLVYFT